MKKGNALSLPKGWEIKKLGDVCDTGAGGTPLKAHKDYYIGGTIPWLMSGEVSQGEVFEAKNFITEKGLKNSSAKLFPINTVLVAMYGATAGQVGILKFEACTNQAVCGILPNDKTIPEYLFYCFLSKKDELVAQAVGGAQPNISQIKIRNTKIPLPPLPEQQRIVSILDEAFSAIAKAKANAEQNLKNAKELFESYLQGVFDPSLRSGQANKDEGWEEKRFDEICVLQRGFDLPTHSRNEGSYPLVSSNGITDRIDLWKVKSPGVVTGRSGTIGNVHYIEEDYWPLNTALYIKEFHGNYERFIYFFLKQFDLGKYSSGAGVPTLNRNNVHSEMVWFPKSIKFQQVIVQKLDTLSTEIKKLEANYQQKIKDLEELKKSVLQKAFAGELRGGEPVEPKTEKIVV
jgi:type I restriction enzyme S subunit